MSKLKSWIILRGGIKRIENGTARPPDAVIEYTNQIPEEDVAYAVVTDVFDTMEQPKQAVDGNGDPVFETLQRPTYDFNGEPILDVNGDPVLEDYQSPVIELDGNGDHVMETITLTSTHKVVSVNAPAKAAGDSDKATKKAANEAKVVKRKKDKDDLDLAFSDVDNIKNVPQIIEYLKLLTKHIVG